MSRRATKARCFCNAKHDGPCLPAPPSPPDCIGQVATPEPRNRAVELIKAESLYIALQETNVYMPYGVRDAFMSAFAAALTDMRLRL